ncbi:MAG: (2Fe-2S)-binding protein [Firmicutes bacterium]|nr:(2Fe-2S)-binding protein [Bacillota bacterium]
MVVIDTVVNGRPVHRTVSARRLLSDFLRYDLQLTGTHVGCEHGVCGACTVLLDGQPVRSCLTLAAQVSGHHITTIEGVAEMPALPAATTEERVRHLHPVQQAFWEEHGLQCGYCTPGFVLTTIALLEAHPDPSDEEIRETLSGNICRCTGYRNIIRAVHRAKELWQTAPSTEGR